MKKVWKGFAAAVSAAAIAATGFIGATSASADPTTTPANGTIMITNTVAGDAFAAYKLLDVTFATTGEGTTATTSYSYKLIAGTNGFSNQTKALVAAANATLNTDTDINLATYTYSDANSVNALQEALIEKIDSFKTNAANVRKYSEELYKQVKTGGANPVTATNTATATGANTEISVPQGYYLAVQTKQGTTGNPATTLNTQSAYIIDTVLSGKVTELELKAESVTFDKKLQDINDSESTTKGPWQDGADYDVNDIVPFKLDATLPANYTNYHYFEMKFNDTLSPGLTYRKDAKVYVVTKNAQNEEVENEITTGFTTTTTPTSADTDTEVTPDATKGTSIVVSTANLKASTVTVANNTPISNGSLIRVKYTAKVNNNAVIGANGNPNTANLQFTANPNVDSDGGLNQTPDDVVKVFTYQYNVDKTFAGPTAPATMPKFTLSKFYAEPAPAEGAEPAPAEGVEDERITIDGVEGNWRTVSEVEVKNVAEAGEAPQYVAAFPRIDDGKYKVEETVVPDGWNKADDVFFKITAVHTETGDSQSLTELKITYYTDGTFANVKTDVAGTTNGVANGNTTTGIVSTGIENTQGSELPSTGGMGTTVLYVAGAAIVLIAGIGLAVALRRRQA